jgi:hypothetical protein
VTAAIESALRTLVLEHAEGAAERSDASWRSISAGRDLLDGHHLDLSRASRDLRPRTEQAVRDWQQAVLDMVRDEAGDKRSTARYLAYGVHGLAVALEVAVLDEAGNSASVVGRQILEAVLGAHGVRTLVDRARADLNHRVLLLLESEQRRYVDLLVSLGLVPAVEEALRGGAREIDDIRFASFPH